MAEANSPTAVRSLLQRYGLAPKKGWGQHFLWQSQVVERIADAAELTKEDVVLEIGPGLGILTAALARRAGQVIAVEIDETLFLLLEETLKGYDNAQFVKGDARQVDYQKLLEDYAPGSTSCKVMGNLPYYISSPLIIRLLQGEFQKELLVFMVQKEVAQRMIARPGSKDYSSLSVVVQYLADLEMVFRVSPNAFCPPPEVDSAVIKLACREHPAVRVIDAEVFFQVVHTAFRYRRKTLRNALKEGVFLCPGEERVFTSSGISPERRGETLELEEFALLADAVAQLQERKEE